MKLSWMSLVAFAAVGMVSAPAIAQQAQPPQQNEMKQKAPSGTYSQGELKSYAKAAIKVKKLDEQYSMKLQSAESPQEQQSVREEATGRMVSAIEEEGLSVEKYNEIYNAAVANPQIAQELNEYLREAR